MAYSRPPVQPGRALTRTPEIPLENTAGVFDYKFDVNIATPTSLGVVEIGSGLSITSAGVLSATGSGSDLVKVTLVSSNYTALNTDYFIVGTKKEIQITLPLGITGKVYIIKNKSVGNVTIKCSGGQTIDSLVSKNLGSEGSLYVIFDGTRWNSIG